MDTKDIKDLMGRMKDVEAMQVLGNCSLTHSQEIQDLQGQVKSLTDASIPEGSLAGLRQEIKDLEEKIVVQDHPPGLCESGHCTPCRNSRALNSQTVRKSVFAEIDAACEKAGVVPARNIVAEAVQAYRAGKEGDPAPSDGDPEKDALASIAAGD